MMKFLLALIFSIFLFDLCVCDDDNSAANNNTMEQHRWFGNATSGYTCIMLDAAFRLNIDRSEEGKKPLIIDVPGDAKVNSHNCEIENNAEQLDLLFGTSDGEWNFTLMFNKTNDQVMLQNFFVTWKEENVTSVGKANLGFKAPDGNAFKCDSLQSFTLEANEPGSWPHNTTTLSVQKLRWQAFMNTTDPKYGDAHICKADMTTNDLVPIIVGACLAALVVIVLIAYLVGRARMQRSTGYESV